jgi:hypothetical protein
MMSFYVVLRQETSVEAISYFDASTFFLFLPSPHPDRASRMTVSEPPQRARCLLSDGLPPKKTCPVYSEAHRAMASYHKKDEAGQTY